MIARELQYNGFTIGVEQIGKGKWRCVTRKLNGSSIKTGTGLHREFVSPPIYESAAKAVDEARRQIDERLVK